MAKEVSSKKKLTREEQIEDVQMKLEEARQARLRNGAKKSPQATSEAVRRVEFQEFWAQARRKYGKMDKGLEEVIWAHLKAIGHTEPTKFEAGISHFGLKKLN
jgi:hypothetical protein